MLFVADESVDAPIYRMFRKQGHSIYAIVETTQAFKDKTILDENNPAAAHVENRY